MIATRTLPAIFLLGVVASCSVTASLAQDTEQPAAASLDRPARAPYSPFKTIAVDDSCRLLPNAAHQVEGKKKPRPISDPVICHIEAVANSEHMEESLVGNELHRSMVTVSEQTYVLQNIATDPVIFEVQHFVPLGWEVDSDPKPDEMNGSTAIFHPHAQPGEIVRLHVGLRRTRPLKTKIVKNAPALPARPQGN